MRKICLLILSLLCLSGFGQYKRNAPVLPRNFVDTVACEFIGGYVVIPVKIGGNVYKYIFDTGSNAHLVKEEIAQKAGFKHDGKSTLTDYNKRVTKVPLVQLDRFEIGNMKFRNSRAWVHKLDFELWKCYGIDGLLGSDIMYGMTVKIDIENKRLIFTNNSKIFANEGGKTSQIRIVNRKPHVQIKAYPFGSYDLLFDTGDPNFISMSNPFLEHFLKKDSTLAKSIISQCVGVSDRGVNGFENPAIKNLLKIDSLSFCGVDILNVYTVSTQKTNTLGSKILKYGSVILNFKDNEFTFIPYEATKTTFDPDMKIGDFGVIDQDKKFVIGYIWEESESYKYGLRQGFTILEVNDRSVESDFCHTLEWIGKELWDGDSYKIKVLNLQGEEQTFEVERKRRITD